jgi:hypothetical protein
MDKSEIRRPGQKPKSVKIICLSGPSVHPYGKVGECRVQESVTQEDVGQLCIRRNEKDSANGHSPKSGPLVSMGPSGTY